MVLLIPVDRSHSGLDALIKDASQTEVIHLFFPHRDRIARPEDPSDGVRIENLFRRAGCTLVFPNRVVQPLALGKRTDIGEAVTALIDYHQAGQFRTDHARKMILAQMALAKSGFSTGGRARYGFRRWLVTELGEAIRELNDGEVIRMKGHHVVWLPTARDEIAVSLRILDLLETMPASRVAAILTAESVPTPNSGRMRTDNGVRHQTSGKWHANTVTNIARNPLLIGFKMYGRRSEGDQLRYSADGPRELGSIDFCETSDVGTRPQTKVVINPESGSIPAAWQ
jgi:hypothetical protein